MKFNSKLAAQRYEQGVCVRCGGERVTKRYCRTCADHKNQITRNSRKRDPERQKQIQRAQDAKRKDKKHKYYLENKEQIADRNKQWAAKNPEKRNAIIRRYRRKYAEHFREYARQYYHAHYAKPTSYFEPITEVYPFFRKTEGVEGMELINLVLSQIPKGLSDDLKGDVCQEIVLKIYLGEIEIESIAAHIPEIIKEQRKFLPSPYKIQIDGLEDWQRYKLENSLIND